MLQELVHISLTNDPLLFSGLLCWSFELSRSNQATLSSLEKRNEARRTEFRSATTASQDAKCQRRSICKYRRPCLAYLPAWTVYLITNRYIHNRLLCLTLEKSLRRPSVQALRSFRSSRKSTVTWPDLNLPHTKVCANISKQWHLSSITPRHYLHENMYWEKAYAIRNWGSSEQVMETGSVLLLTNNSNARLDLHQSFGHTEPPELATSLFTHRLWINTAPRTVVLELRLA
jgi:hypothetical protein